MPHPQYGKYQRRTTQLLAHDENSESRKATGLDRGVPAAVAPQELAPGEGRGARPQADQAAEATP